MNSNLRIEKLILNNFRNHNYLKLDIKKNMVLIYGKNGSGKRVFWNQYLYLIHQMDLRR